MPDIWLDVDVTIASMAVNKVPLVLDTDGVTIDETVAYNEAGMDLHWNFQTTAGVFTCTSVTPTSAGVLDWDHVNGGMYTMAMPASAGAVNNDAEGFGWWSGKCTAVAPWTSPIYGFRAASLNDALVDSAGGAVLPVNATQVSGTAQTAKDLGALLQIMRDGIITGTAVTGTLTNTACSTDLTGYTVDQLVGRVITFLGGAADGESTDITAYAVTNGVITYTALSGAIAPANTDPFKIT